MAAELRRSLIGAGAVALGGMVLWGLQKASAGINFDAVVAGIRATSPTALLGSFAATFLSFIALLGYDLSGLRYAGARSPFTAALLASFCGFAIGNTVGLGAFSGGAVRYRLYSAAGLSPGQMRASYSLSRSPTASDSQRSPEPCATLQRGLRNCVPCAVSWHFIRLRIGPTVTIPGRDRPCLEQKGGSDDPQRCNHDLLCCVCDRCLLRRWTNKVAPNPFGFLFLGLAALVWFAWKPMSAGLDQQGIFDAMSRNWMGLRDRKRSSDNSN